MNLLELASRDPGTMFSDPEMEFIKMKMPLSRYKLHYCFYKKVSFKKCQINVVIDQFHNCTRRTLALNVFEIFISRQLNDVEYHEMIVNFGTDHRRLKVYNYKTIDQVIADDQKYGIKTPDEFIKECENRGFIASNSNINNQLKLNI